MKKIISHSLSFLAGFLFSSYSQYKTKPVVNSIIRNYGYEKRSDDDLKAVALLGLGTFKAFMLEFAYLEDLTYDEIAPLPEEDDANSFESLFSDKILTEDDARHNLEKKGTKFGFSKKELSNFNILPLIEVINITKTSRNPLAVIPMALSETQQSMANGIAKELANLVTNAEIRNKNTEAGKMALDILQKWESSKANIHAIRFLTTILSA